MCDLPRVTMSGRFGWAVFGLVYLVAAPVAAQRPASPKPIKNDEHWLEKVPVAGGTRVGVVTLTSGAKVNPEKMTFMLPASPAKLLCIEVSSRDGRYSAKVEYPTQGLLPGNNTLSRSSLYKGPLGSYTADQLAILTQLGDDCTRPNGPFIVSSWHEPASVDTVVVLLNSRVPTSIVGGVGKTDHEASCAPLEGVTTAFNLRCLVPALWIKPDMKFYIRMRRGTSFSQVALPLELPPPQSPR